MNNHGEDHNDDIYKLLGRELGQSIAEELVGRFETVEEAKRLIRKWHLCQEKSQNEGIPAQTKNPYAYVKAPPEERKAWIKREKEQGLVVMLHSFNAWDSGAAKPCNPPVRRHCIFSTTEEMAFHFLKAGSYQRL